MKNKYQGLVQTHQPGPGVEGSQFPIASLTPSGVVYTHTHTIPQKPNKYTHVYRPTEISIPYSLVHISSQMQTHMSI